MKIIPLKRQVNKGHNNVYRLSLFLFRFSLGFSAFFLISCSDSNDGFVPTNNTSETNNPQEQEQEGRVIRGIDYDDAAQEADQDGNFVRLTAGGHHTCAVSSNNGPVKCWGMNQYGQLGVGNFITQPTPQEVNLGSGSSNTATIIAAGNTHTCALAGDNKVKCWGRNNSGQLCLKGATKSPLPREINLNSNYGVTAMTTGDHHTCVILDDDGNKANGGPLKCWGYNEMGQLGLGTKVNSRSAQDVDLGTNHTAKAIAAGIKHTCAILDDDSVKCWGFNYGGQLGLGHTRDQTTPQGVDLGTGHTAKKIVAGANHTCAILDNDKVKCWGLELIMVS